MGRPVRPVRHFLALCPDASARQALVAVPGSRSGRVVHPEDLHLTLAFLGELAVAPAALGEALASASARVGPVVVVLDRVETWPGPGAACAAGEVPRAAALSAALWQSLAAFGYRADPRPFRAHVTLARGLPRSVGETVSLLAVPIRWTSREILLMASAADAGPAGSPRYRILGRCPLD